MVSISDYYNRYAKIFRCRFIYNITHNFLYKHSFQKSRFLVAFRKNFRIVESYEIDTMWTLTSHLHKNLLQDLFLQNFWCKWSVFILPQTMKKSEIKNCNSLPEITFNFVMFCEWLYRYKTVKKSEFICTYLFQNHCWKCRLIFHVRLNTIQVCVWIAKWKITPFW